MCQFLSCTGTGNLCAPDSAGSLLLCTRPMREEGRVSGAEGTDIAVVGQMSKLCRPFRR